MATTSEALAAIQALDVKGLEKAARRALQAGDRQVAEYLALEVERRMRFTPLAHQELPPGLWTLWLLMGGRGSGKTAAACRATDDHMRGPACDESLPGGHRAAIIGPTFGDAVDSCYYGPSGLATLAPDVKLRTIKGGITIAEWPQGGRARFFGAYVPEDPERLRAGGGNCWLWLEELAAWRQLEPHKGNPSSFDQAMLGLRIGSHPRAVASTTPKNRPTVHTLSDAGKRYAATGQGETRRDRVVVTKASTDENPHLDAEVRADLFARYGGTRLGDQELLGLLLDDLGTRYSRADFLFRDDVPAWPVKIRSWDLAGTEPGPANEDPDWTAGARLSLESNSVLGLVNVDDLVHVREGVADVEKRVIATARLDGPDTIVIIEKEGGQAGKAQIAHYQKVLRPFAKRVIGFQPTGSKESRSELVERASQQGRVSLTRAPWNLALLDEAESFPDGAHDDIVDALSQAFTWLEAGGAAGPAKASTVAQRRLAVALK